MFDEAEVLAEASTEAPDIALLPLQHLPKSNAIADFLAMLLTVKLVDALVLTRFNKLLGRHGVPEPDQTLARWVISSVRLISYWKRLKFVSMRTKPYNIRPLVFSIAAGTWTKSAEIGS